MPADPRARDMPARPGAPGRAQRLSGGVTRILAPNPSAMTGPGTNTYLLGTGTGIAVIDPGPDSPEHLRAIRDALGPGRHVSHVLVTHAHLDHSAAAPRLAAEWDAPLVAFGDPESGRSEAMQRLAAAAPLGGGEGVDHGLVADQRLTDGAHVTGDGWQLVAHWMPGHLGDHMCFQLGATVFSGDLVMGWASTLISPPDGDLTDFLASCARLRRLGARRLLPGHGPAVTDPRARIDWLVAHRVARTRAILQTLATDGPMDAGCLARAIYTDTPAALLPAAERNVLAHLIDLCSSGKVLPLDRMSAAARFALCPPTTPGTA